MGVEQPAFESLTKYLSKLNTDTLGTWIIDRENDGTPEHPIQMPFVDYSDMVHRFIDDVYEYVETCKDLELNRYGEILERNGLEWGESMSAADVSALDAQCVMALIVGAVRAERFCDGVLLGFFRDGSIRKWLTRLKEIDGGHSLTMNNDIILETKLVAEIRGDFYVPSYQRGYRWGEVEVTRLLDDVYQNGKKNYCLQPVVVRKKDDMYELIDGQQRLTTLYLIYKYMKNVNPFFSEPAFTLSYQTREQSADFLKTLDISKQDDNIDFWFITNAYKTIQKWFEQDMQIRVMHIFEYFKEDVKIIWYEVGESEDAISLFTRLNIGKIPLTSAELVKAMFLSRDNSEDMSREKQEEISLQWDSIERELHNESLWYFLTNSVKSEYQTRIDLVLDLISGKDEAAREKYYTFFKFEEMRKEVSLDDIWKKIYQTFLILKGWYEDHDIYHKIGYLIASGTSLHIIFTLSKDKKKTEFNEALDELIKKSVAISGNYAELSYEKPLDYKRISTLLLLFNVESVRKADGHAQRFPFDKFKHNKGSNVTWSLEHIHAQQSEGMKTQEVWKKWLELHIPSVKGIDGDHGELIDEMQNAIDMDKLERSVFEAIQQKVLVLLSVSGNTEYMHSIANLALLNTADNAALNNSTFDVKRNDIIKMDKKGQYIPFCTKMVFLKYYTPSEDNQLHFWGQADRIAYIKAINDVLADYIEPIVLEKEETK